MEIPHRELAKDTLIAIIEEYVTREGTEYGETDIPLQEKIDQVIEQLERGEALITFDPESETCSLISKNQLS